MAKARTKASNVVVWIILVLLIVALAGFSVTDFGSSQRSIGRVGEAEIAQDRYIRALETELRQLSAQFGTNVTFSQAQSFGAQARVLQRAVASASAEHESMRIGLSIDDEEVARQIRAATQFHDVSGNFDPDLYEFALDRVRMSKSDYEDELRRETAAAILQIAASSGVNAPDTYRDVIVGYLGETRSFSWVYLQEQDLEEPIAEPDAAELRAFYDANIDRFQLPETRVITYAWLTPEAMMEEIEFDEAAVRALYDDRIDEYAQPERRLVERLIYGDMAAAQSAMDRLNSGETSFEDLVAARGLELADVDMGDAARAELGAAADAVFALEEPGVAGPVEIDLGFAIFRVNAILAARETPFEDVQEELRVEYAGDQARRAIADRINDFDDLLAGGATMEELAAETAMELGRINYAIGEEEGIAAYAEFVETARVATPDDLPEIIELSDGGIFAMRVDEILPRRPEPFENAAERVAEAWHAERVTSALTAQAEELAAAVSNGASLSSLGYITSVETRLDRDAFIENAPEGLVADVFALEPGDVTITAGAEGVAIARLSDIHPADLAEPRLAALGDAITNDVSQSVAEDMLRAYLAAIQSEAGISLNQTAINAAHSVFPN